MSPIAPHHQFLLAAFVILAGLSDLRLRRVPNWLTLGALAAALAAALSLQGAGALIPAFGGIAVALLVTLPLFALRALGGGDVKMMAAAAAMTGPMNFVVIFVINAVAGGIAALILASAKGRLGQTLRNTATILRSAARARAPHRDDPRLDIAAPDALTLPRAAIFAVCVLIVLAFGPS